MNRWVISLVWLLPINCTTDKAATPAAASNPTAAPIAETGPAPPGMTRLDELELQIELPPGSDIYSLVESTYDLITPGGHFLIVKKGNEVTPATEADARRLYESVFSPRYLESETLPDGWIFRFQAEATFSFPAAHMLQGRRKIAGQVYECEAQESHAADLRPLVDACKSLRR